MTSPSQCAFSYGHILGGGGGGCRVKTLCVSLDVLVCLKDDLFLRGKKKNNFTMFLFKE